MLDSKLNYLLDDSEPQPPQIPPPNNENFDTMNMLDDVIGGSEPQQPQIPPPTQ